MASNFPQAKVAMAIAGRGSTPASTPEHVRTLRLQIAELDAEMATARRDIVLWYRRTLRGALEKSEDDINAFIEQAEHKGTFDEPVSLLTESMEYMETFAKRNAKRKELAEALANETLAATEAISTRAACELRALVPGYEPLNPAARALVTGAVTDKALSVLLDDTANLRVLGEVGARVFAATELRTAALIRESEERTASRLADSEERASKRLAESQAHTAALIKESEARTAALLETMLGGTRGALLGSAFAARMAGVSAATLRDKYSAYDMKTAGFTAAELKTAGFTAAELKAAGFSAAAELKAAGFTAAELKAVGLSTAAELKAAGCTAVELKAAGFDTAAELRAAGFTAAEVKIAGFGLLELRDAGAQCACHPGNICPDQFYRGALSWSA